MPYIERVAESNNRVTKGKIYAMLSNRIIDDLGGAMYPSYKLSSYWRVLTKCEEPIESIQSTEQENKMLKVETVTLINGQRIKDVKSETLIDFIQKEEAHIDALQEVRAQSKAITSLKKRHSDNIKALVKILDDMDPEDE